MLFPRVAHRFTGYLEEEAVHTYSEMLKDLDKGLIPNVPAPTVAINYWYVSRCTRRCLSSSS